MPGKRAQDRGQQAGAEPSATCRLCSAGTRRLYRLPGVDKIRKPAVAIVKHSAQTLWAPDYRVLQMRLERGNGQELKGAETEDATCGCGGAGSREDRAAALVFSLWAPGRAAERLRSTSGPAAAEPATSGHSSTQPPCPAHRKAQPGRLLRPVLRILTTSLVSWKVL